MTISILTCGNPIQTYKNRYINLADPSIHNEIDVYVFDTNKNSTADTIRAKFKAVIETTGMRYAVVSNTKVFKALTGKAKAIPFYANLVPCVLNTDINIIYLPPPNLVYYNPTSSIEIIKRGFLNIKNHLEGCINNAGLKIVSPTYAYTNQELKTVLEMLSSMECDLTCDIEAFSLEHYTAGVGTISFAWNKNEGVAACIDYNGNQDVISNVEAKKLLANFFRNFKHRMIFYKANYDVTVLIYELFMDGIEDTEGLLEGIKVFSRITEDAILVSYLAINSTSRNPLGLKELSQEYSGNYSINDIHDIKKIPINELLEYNLTDTLSTWYVLDKYYPRMVSDNQEKVYSDLFRPALFDIIQMQLTGMPVLPNQIDKVKGELLNVSDSALKAMNSNTHIINFVSLLKERWVIERNAKLKTKRVTLADAVKVEFNPNSSKQLIELLYKELNLPVINTTESNQPSTDNETLKSLASHTTDTEIKEFLSNLVDFKDTNKMLTTFIPILSNHVIGKSGQAYIYGSLNLGGTVSGRLSSKGGLQQLPANSRYSKLIKSCFGMQDDEWIFCGLDFTSLESKIGALVTRDPIKMAVYTDGYDSHSFNTYTYFPDKLHIQSSKINEIAPNRKYFKITNDDGSVEYVTDLDPRITP